MVNRVIVDLMFKEVSDEEVKKIEKALKESYIPLEYIECAVCRLVRI